MNSLSQKIILQAIEEKVETSQDLLKVVRFLHKSEKKSGYPSNISLLKAYRSLLKEGKIKENKTLENLLVTKRMRSLSGVSVITVLTKPYPCPGKCIYCPTEKDVPKSYLSGEPAVMRAILCKYDARKQVEVRLKSLDDQGHPTDKIELIVIGGTFSYLPKDYQESYIKECFDTLNAESQKVNAKIQKDINESAKEKVDTKTQRVSKNLAQAKKWNETAKHRMVGLTLETRPDFIDQKEIKWFRYLGATRVELGVQSLDDKILEISDRGHKVQQTVEATKLLKDAGFKICYHMMPNLPGSDLKKDLQIFKTLFSDERFKPDFIKIYPCMVIEKTGLYKLWKEGKYKSYTDEELYKLMKEIKKIVPYYVRIKRLIRDIPSRDIVSGSKLSNLRQILQDSKAKEGWDCKCIRCREVKGDDFSGKLTFFREDYEASEGKEIFLSYENEERTQLYSLLRLRIPSLFFCHPEFNSGSKKIPNQVWNDSCPSEIKNEALIREVHTYGQELGVGEKGKASQHKGLGRKLLEEAERIAKEEFNLTKIAVIAGVGVREYYSKFGYELEGEYMTKKLK